MAVGKRPFSTMFGLRRILSLSVNGTASVKARSWKIPLRMSCPLTCVSTASLRVSRKSIWAIAPFWCSCLDLNSRSPDDRWPDDFC